MDNYQQVGVLSIRDTTLVRDWVCGICGSRLKTIWRDGWLTICAADETHDGDKFITSAALVARRTREMERRDMAQEVLAHLPAELRETLKGALTCPSRD